MPLVIFFKMAIMATVKTDEQVTWRFWQQMESFVHIKFKETMNEDSIAVNYSYFVVIASKMSSKLSQ